LQDAGYVKCKEVEEINPNPNEGGATKRKTQGFRITKEGLSAIH
jgi:hypothetical protein